MSELVLLLIVLAVGFIVAAAAYFDGHRKGWDAGRKARITRERNRVESVLRKYGHGALIMILYPETLPKCTCEDVNQCNEWCQAKQKFSNDKFYSKCHKN